MNLPTLTPELEMILNPQALIDRAERAEARYNAKARLAYAAIVVKERQRLNTNQALQRGSVTRYMQKQLREAYKAHAAAIAEVRRLRA